MGNSSSKDSRSRSGAAAAAASNGQQQQQPLNATIPPQSRSAEIRVVPEIRASGGSGGSRGTRQDIPIFLSRRAGGGGGNGDNGSSREDRPRETRQEREARRAERERQARLKERERSMREEGVDGGFLVTLGVYTGAEDFNKGIVRQLQIERRLAPFWKGLNDHSDSWAEHQLVAAVRGLPIPAADEIPPEMARTASQNSNLQASDVNVNKLTVPISSRSQSYESSTSANLSASHPAFSSSASGSQTPTAAQLFRGRAKTLASLATGSKSHSPDLTPQEIRLPHDPNINGTPIEAYLYKDASECPICFMYYPPHLNKTRCCDQPICSECFVQIKRPDPHPPEHEQPGQPRPPEEEAEMLVSEVAACPFCVTPEFGVSYDPPPFRRGLAYANNPQNGNATNPLRNPTSAMSSSTSLTSGGSNTASQSGGAAGRRRATSLSANAPQVITTDRVRPDWAKKLADARANALRRSAAATALHNAAYVLGSQEGSGLRSGGSSSALANLGRRGRRTIFVGTPGGSGSGGSGTPLQGGDGEDGGSGSDLFPERGSSARRGTGLRGRVEDIEELMMMEAIRLSLAAEEERKRKEEKEVRKEAKKRDKEAKKEAKAAEKIAKKNNGSISSLPGVLHAAGGSSSGGGAGGGFASSASASASTSAFGAAPYPAARNLSTSTWASADNTPDASLRARSNSNLGSPGLPQQQQDVIPEESSEVGGGSVSVASSSGAQGKGKEPAQDFAGFNPLEEPSSTLNTEMKDSSASAEDGHGHADDEHAMQSSSPRENPQKHLEASRANLQPIVASAHTASTAAGTSSTTPIPIPGSSLSPNMNPEQHSGIGETPSPASTASASASASFRGEDDDRGGGGGGGGGSVGTPSPGHFAGGDSEDNDEPLLNYASLANRIGGLGIDETTGDSASPGAATGEKEGMGGGSHVEVAPAAAAAAAAADDATATADGTTSAVNGDLHERKVTGNVEVLEDQGAAGDHAG